MTLCILHGSSAGKAILSLSLASRIQFGKWDNVIRENHSVLCLVLKIIILIDLLRLCLFFSPDQVIARCFEGYFIGHVVGVWHFVRVGAEGIIMAEDILLDGLVHESANIEYMFWTFFEPTKLFYPGSVS